jgi:hypothetical protein
MKGLLVLALLTLPTGAGAMHPEITLKDAAGFPVTESRKAISPMQTCGGCHDTEWIADHSPHSDLGFGETSAAREFDTGPGAINRFDPIDYDRIDFSGAFTIGVADWLLRHGGRHVGGGFATRAPDGEPLTSLSSESPGPFTHHLGEEGIPVPWDWAKSGVAELNCFLCHLPEPDDAARRAALSEGRFGDAASETLGLGFREDGGWSYASAVVELEIQSPGPENCGLCHTTVVTEPQTPFFHGPDADRRQTLTTGSIFAPGRIPRSGMNVASRDSLARPWDIHAERLLGCTDCHPSVNNPAHFSESTETRPEHLSYDARRLNIGDYLKRPSHALARGRSAQTTARRDLDDSMRRCEDCHQATAVHDWLPYRDRHLAGLQCEACHIPAQYGATLANVDWTVVDERGEPIRRYRGTTGDPSDPHTLVEGYRPVLLPRSDANGQTRLAPHNLVTSWFWVDGTTGIPVTRETLEEAFLTSDGLHPSLMSALDATGDGEITGLEQGLYGPHQTAIVARRLEEVGVADPRIQGEIQPYGTHHGVATGKWAIRDCGSCHGEESRLTEEFWLADFAPGGVMPEPVTDSGLEFAGSFDISECGHVVYQPDPDLAGLYLVGSSRIPWIGRLGKLTVVLVLAGIVLHAGLRFVLASARHRREEHAEERRARVERARRLGTQEASS